MPNDTSQEYVITESRHSGGHSDAYFSFVEYEIRDTLELYKIGLGYNDIEETIDMMDALSHDERIELRKEISSTLADIKIDLLNGDLKIHNN